MQIVHQNEKNSAIIFFIIFVSLMVGPWCLIYQFEQILVHLLVTYIYCDWMKGVFIRWPHN